MPGLKGEAETHQVCHSQIRAAATKDDGETVKHELETEKVNRNAV